MKKAVMALATAATIGVTALVRAKWMTEHGYRLLLRGGASA
jgi:hypothetical protein